MSTAALGAVGGIALADGTNAAAATAARRFWRKVLFVTLACAGPASVLLAAGSVRLAGLFFWAILGVLLLRLGALGRADVVLCVLLALSPWINLLRGFAFYNVVIAVFFAGLALRHARSPQGFASLLRQQPLLKWIGVWMVAYYALTLVTTYQYDVNLRVFEFLFAAAATLVVGRSQEMLASALKCLMISVISVGMALLPHTGTTSADRLGIAMIDGKILGNPIQLGVPLALTFLALFVDRGSWLGWSRRPVWRIALLVPVGGLLVLTTSRVSWLVAATGVLCVLVFGRRTRLVTAAAVLGGALLLQAIRWSPLGAPVDAAIARTFGSDRDVRNRTSGRSDQWIVAYHAVQESAKSLLIGHGAGSGPEVYAQKSSEISSVEFEVGRQMALHSLYMQVAVETGLVGFLPLLAWLVFAMVRVTRWTLQHGLLFPLVCLLGYALVAATVSGNDTTSGILAGIGLIGAARGATGRVVRRRTAIRQ